MNENTEIELSQELMLVKYTTLTAADVYDGGRVSEIVNAIEKEAMSLALTPDTNKGRSEIASLAHKVARSKTFLDNLGKDRVAEWKEKSKKVDAERKLLRDRLDEIKDRVRQPLTEWEQREQSRKDRIEANLNNLREYPTRGFDGTMGPSGYPQADEIERRIIELRKVDYDPYCEFQNEAERVVNNAIERLQVALAVRLDYDKQHAELARLKREEEERKAREAEQARIREEKERKECEEREAKEREARIREEEQKRAREAAEQEKREFERKLKEAEESRIRAEERAKAEKEEAVRREQDRINAEKQKEADERKKREADNLHREKIIKESLDDLMTAGHSDTKARSLIDTIMAGKIRNVTLNF